MNDDDPMYRPSSIQISVGQSVEWQNDGQVSHSVSDDPVRATNPLDALRPGGVQPFSSGNVMPGGRFRHTFAKPGRYRYFCVNHEMDRMIGEVIVEPAPAPAMRVAQSNPKPAITASESDTAAPIWIVKMNDDEPMYQPNRIQIVTGQTVEWQNNGQVSHSVTDDPQRATQPMDALSPSTAQLFNSGNVMPGARFRHTFTKPGRYRYFCLTHEMDRMVGEVIVESPTTERQAAESKPAPSPNRIGPPPIRIIKMNDDDPMYQPRNLQIAAGQTVEWQNEGQLSHSITDDQTRASNPLDALRPSGVEPFNSGNVMPGGSFRHTFTKPGRYRYFCQKHESARMIGEIDVRPAEPSEEGVEGTQPAGLSSAPRPRVED
jgi:plastocyanin